MPTKKENRFRKKSYTDVAGFNLPTYRSLLYRERERILDLKRDIFSGIQSLITLSDKAAESLKVSTDEALYILQNGGLGTDGTSYKADVLPFLVELASLQNEDNQNQKYLRATVEAILSSRLEADWLQTSYPELNEAFGSGITASEVKAFAKVPATDVFESSAVSSVVKKILNSLPEDIVDELTDFIAVEENKGEPLEDEPGTDPNP